MKTELYIGLMSGTSLDGSDCVLMEFAGQDGKLLHQLTESYPEQLQRRLHDFIDARGHIRLEDIGSLHEQIAITYATVVSKVLAAAQLETDRITAIGSHGQTVCHSPDSTPPFSLQLGNPSTLAALTGIVTVADFRSADIALGGQGAPLVPAFHEWMFADPTKARVVINIGGIANISVLQPGQPVTGFDVGPGNTLMDRWGNRHRGMPYDDNGSWAASGQVNEELLALLRADPYFGRIPPKSTGREHFHLDWLDGLIAKLDRAPEREDVQASLAELTVVEIAQAVESAAPGATAVGVCGGGALNQHLMSRLQHTLPDRTVEPTDAWGLAPEWVEAAAFAWLARQRLLGQPGTMPSVTGATRAGVLGGVYLPAT
jgi:anhydro-N-acetylmuramic acid kinase